MKTIMLSLALVAGLASAATAQSSNPAPAAQQNQRQRPAKSPEDRAKKDTEWATQQLGLNADQQAKWQAASLTRANANEPLKGQMQATTDKNEKQKIAAQLKANMQQFDNTVNGFLTADQKTKWEQAKQEKKARHKGHKGQGQPTQAPSTPGN